MKRTHMKGFTLIELLVVVAIIGILATVVLSSLNSARSKARDAKREQDIKTIQTALEIYYLENGYYPTTTLSHSYNVNKWTELQAELGVTLPQDPLGETGDPGVSPYPHNYDYRAWDSPSWCNKQGYALIYNKENSTNSTDGFKGCSGSTYGFGPAFVA